MTRFVLLFLLIGVAVPAQAQRAMRVAGARFTIPEAWHLVQHPSAAVLSSADGTVRYIMRPGFNDYDDSEVDPALRREAAEYVDRDGGAILERSEPLRVELLGAQRPAFNVLVRDGIRLRRTLFVLHVDGIRRRVLGLDVQAPADLDTELQAFQDWLGTVALDEAPAVSPAPRDGALDGTYAALTTRTRRAWIAASDAVSPLFAEDDSTRAAHAWTTIDVDAYTFWPEASRVYWGLPDQPLDSLDATAPGEERLRWGRYEPDGDRLRIWYRFGNEAAFPFEADSASVHIDGRAYVRLDPVTSLEHIEGTWLHDDVDVGEVAGEDGRMRIEKVGHIKLHVGVAGEVELTTQGETWRTGASGYSGSTSPPRTTTGRVEAGDGRVLISLPNRDPLAISAYWHGETLLLGGDAFRRVEPLADRK